MRPTDRPKEQLIRELKQLRLRNALLEAREARRKKVGRKLKEQIYLFQQIIDSLPSPVFFKNIEGKYLACNKAFEKYIGLAKSDILGKTSYDLAPQHLADIYRRMDNALFQYPGTQTYESSIVTREGKQRDVIFNKTTFKGASGSIAGLVGVIVDITERKMAERAMKSERQRLYALLDGMPAPIHLLGRNYSISFVNRQFREHFGDPGGRTCYQLFQRKDTPCAECPTYNVLAGNIPNKKEWASPDGRVYKTHYFPLYDNYGSPLVLVMSIDITEHKQVEKKLQASEERYRQLVELCPDAIVVHCEGKVAFVNKIGAKFYGVDSPEELIGRPILDFVHPDYWPTVKERVSRMLSEGVSMPLIEQKYILKDGTIEDVEVAAAPLTFQGRPSVQLVLRIITDRKRTEEALRLSIERFNIIFNASPSLLSIRSAKSNRYIDVNESWLRHMGYTREEVIGRTPEELNFDVDPVIGDRRRKKTLKKSIWNEEFHYRKKSGEEHIGLISTNIIDLEGEKSILSEIRDITELKRLEKEMSRLERLNLIGEMAAGIGHEIRNPMTTVRGFLQMLAGKEGCVAYKEYFDLMIEELDRANFIITEFLTLAKNKPANLEVTSLNSVIKALWPLIMADATNLDIDAEIILEEIPDFLLNQKEMRQLILNLVRNGLEAMSSGGTLTIATYQEDGRAVLSVQDRGKGINPELLDRLGTPFFTTKDTGTGLGLAICYSIAARHNAVIKIITGSGGTTFNVIFNLGQTVSSPVN